MYGSIRYDCMLFMISSSSNDMLKSYVLSQWSTNLLRCFLIRFHLWRSMPCVIPDTFAIFLHWVPCMETSRLSSESSIIFDRRDRDGIFLKKNPKGPKKGPFPKKDRVRALRVRGHSRPPRSLSACCPALTSAHCCAHHHHSCYTIFHCSQICTFYTLSRLTIHQNGWEQCCCWFCRSGG